MATVNATESKIFEKGGDTKLQNVSGKNWLSFLDAVGWVEGTDSYNANNGKNYIGIYQHGQEQLDYMNFFKSFGADAQCLFSLFVSVKSYSPRDGGTYGVCRCSLSSSRSELYK